MSKNVAVKENDTALAVMAGFEEDAHAGFDNMNQEDFALPFLRLLTNTSPEVGDVEGAIPGMIYNTVTGELYDGKKRYQCSLMLVHPCVHRVGATRFRQWCANRHSS